MTQPKRIFSCRISDAGTSVTPGGKSLIFPYWSFTKTVLAICALRLVEDGRIALDAPVSGQRFTLRQLLNHTAGLPDYGALPTYSAAVKNGDVPWTRKELMHAVMSQKLLFAPGAGWSYSNVGYMLVRELIEDATGQPLGLIIKNLVTDRLKLESVELATTKAQFSRVLWDTAKGYDPGWVYHGCLIGNVRDAARLLHGLFAGKLLKEATFLQMLAPHPVGGAIAGRPWSQCGYALGLMSGTFDGTERVIGHSGAGPFCVNAVYHFPDRDTPVTVASFTDGDDEGIAEFDALRYSA